MSCTRCDSDEKACQCETARLERAIRALCDAAESLCNVVAGLDPGSDMTGIREMIEAAREDAR